MRNWRIIIIVATTMSQQTLQNCKVNFRNKGLQVSITQKVRKREKKGAAGITIANLHQVGQTIPHYQIALDIDICRVHEHQNSQRHIQPRCQGQVYSGRIHWLAKATLICEVCGNLGDLGIQNIVTFLFRLRHVYYSSTIQLVKADRNFKGTFGSNKYMLFQLTQL